MPETTPNSDSGVQIDLISGSRMAGLRSMEKIRLILDGVREGNIVILEEGRVARRGVQTHRGHDDRDQP